MVAVDNGKLVCTIFAWSQAKLWRYFILVYNTTVTKSWVINAIAQSGGPHVTDPWLDT